MRKIPEKVKQKAFQMWLQGDAYREIGRKLGVSIGAISATVEEARKRAPDLDQLRKISVILMKEGDSVPDAVRGARLLDKVNQLGLSLDRLGQFVEVSNRIASEKELGGSEFVESALKLMSLEREGKSYGQVVKDFEKKQCEIKDLEEKFGKRKQRLEGEAKELEEEIERLKQEETMITNVFESQGLSWEEGIKIVKDISDLRGEGCKLQDRVFELKTEVSNCKAKANQAGLRSLQLNQRLSNLREAVKKEEREFHHLMSEIISAEKALYTMRDETRKLGKTVKTFEEIIFVHELQERKTVLQAEVKKLTAQFEELTPNVETLTAEASRLEAERNNLRLDTEKLRSERAKQIKKAKELAESIIEDAEQQRRTILAEAEEERKRLLADGEEEKTRILGEIEKLRAEEAFLEAAVKMKVEEFKEARERLEQEEAERDEDIRTGPVGNLLSHIPKLQPIKTVKRD